MNIRKREKINHDEVGSLSKETESPLKDQEIDYSKSEIDKKNQLSLIYWCCLFVCIFILFDLAIRLQSSCDFETDVLCKINVPQDEVDSFEPMFNDSLARHHLQEISRLGRRPAGSTANEVHTPGYILKYTRELVAHYSSLPNANLIVTIDEHVSQQNSFSLKLFGKYHISSIYNHVRSIAIRVHDVNNDDTGSETSAILINCHYDSFFGGLGASDDLASCVAMLETLHSLVRAQPFSLRHDVILLFNGAEENILQGSHAFVTQHRWWPLVQLVVNLESAGSGGRQMLFQTSPEHPWLAAELGRVLRQPFASVIGQEIFAANLIPSDTDYRIFRDTGHVTGIDLAFIGNGYVYHTSYDTERRISQSCLRHTGRNILRLVCHLANNPLLGPSADTPLHQPDQQRTVFFDLFGLVLISYTEFSGTCLNCALVTLALAFITIYNVRAKHTFTLFAHALLSQVTWLIANTLLAILLGVLIHRFGARMTWYSIRYNVVGLFFAPLICFYFFYHTRIAPCLFRVQSSTATAECLRHAAIFLVALFTLILTVNRLLSCYFVSLWLLFCLINEILAKVLQRFLPPSDILHLVRDSVSYSLPLTYYFYMLFTLYDVFIPILGRSGPTYPDLVISSLTGVALIIPGLLFAGNIIVTASSSKQWLIFLFLHFSISYYIFIHSTQFGFPYNQSELLPRKQRIFINHVTRNIRNSRGQTQLSDSGLWILSMDTNNVAFLKARLEQILNIPMKDVFCELRPYCGYPILFPFASLIDNSLWIPKSAHKMTPSATIIILNKITHISGMVNITLQATGPTHSSIYIMTPQSMRIIGWSLGPDPPKPIEMPAFVHNGYLHYFIYYGYGDKPLTPLSFWITFLPKRDQSENQIEIALAAHYLMASSPELESMVHIMPKWTVPTYMASSYEHIVVDFDEHLSFTQ